MIESDPDAFSSLSVKFDNVRVEETVDKVETLWNNSFLPGIFQGCHINNSKIDPQTVIEHVHNAYLPTEAQRKQLDLLEKMNQEHL